MSDVLDTSRVVVTGIAEEHIAAVSDGLAAQGVEVVAAASQVAETAGALVSSDLDAVLHCMCAIPEENTQSYLQLLAREISEIRHYTNAPVILVAEQAHAALADTAVRAGASDVTVWTDLVSLAFAVRKTRVLPASPPATEPEATGGTVYTVFSPKGGTGKTVLSTNLCAAFAARDRERVLLVDLDLQFGDAAIMLGVDPTRTLADLAVDGGELDAQKLRGYTTRHRAGFDLLAAPLKPEQAEVITEQLVQRVLEVARDVYDTIVVDTSPFFYGPMLAILAPTDQLLMVSSPDVPTLKNVRLSLQTLGRLGFPAGKTAVVLSRVKEDVGVSREDVEAALGVPVRFEVPDDVAVAASVNRGVPPVLMQPDSIFADAVRTIVSALRGEETPASAQPRRPRSFTRRLVVGRRLLERRV